MKPNRQLRSSYFVTILIATTSLMSCYYHNIRELPVSPLASPHGSWDKLGDFEGDPRTDAVSFTIGSYAYVGTGYNALTKLYFNDFWRYDPVADHWDRMPDLPGVARGNAVAFVLNGKAYVGTGTSGGVNGLRDFYMYDPSSTVNGTWTRVADLDSTRYGAVAFIVEGRAFVGTGACSKSGKGTSDFWEYDQASDAWTKRPDFIGQPRMNAFVVTINDKAYVGGGMTADKTQDPVPHAEQYPRDFYVFVIDDLTKASPWFQLNVTVFNGAPVSNSSSATFSIGNFGYIVDGSPEPNAVSGANWQYDPLDNYWTPYFSYVFNDPIAGLARHGAVGFTIGDYGYVACGGGSGLSALDDVWKFDPNGVEPDHK